MAGALQRADRVRRGSVHQDYLLVQLQNLHLEGAAADRPAKVKSKKESFKAENDGSLHALPRGLYTEPTVTVIKVSGCPLRYLGCTQPPSPDQVSEFYRSLTISPLSKLTHLEVTNGKLESLPGGFGALPVLRVIDVSRNVLRTLPPDIADGPSIQVINVSRNLLSAELPAGMLDSTTLKVLMVQNNDLTEEHFPEPGDLEAAQLQLAELHLDEAVLRARGGIPPYPTEEVKPLARASYLSTVKRMAQSSSFSLVPPKGDAGAVKFDPNVLIKYRWEELEEGDEYQYEDEFRYRPLEVVVRSSDHLQGLYEASSIDRRTGVVTGPMTKVSQIFISGDREVESQLLAIKLATNLRTLVITGCNITKLPDHLFEGMHSLKYVDFRGNCLVEVPSSFSTSGSVRVALFDNNFIVDFPLVPRNLVYLSMNANCLGLGSDPGRQHIVSQVQFTGALCLKRLECFDNPMLRAEFFPEGSFVPEHIRLNTLVLDEKAVESTAQEHWPFHMCDGKAPVFRKVASPSWLERLSTIPPLKRLIESEEGRPRFFPNVDP